MPKISKMRRLPWSFGPLALLPLALQPAGGETAAGSTERAYIGAHCSERYEQGVCAQNGSKPLVADAAADGLIAYYTFDDELALDSSGHGHHARVVPPAGPGRGPLGFGARFDGVSMMEVPHSDEFNSEHLTVSCWIYLLEDSTNSYRTVWRKAATASDMTPSLLLLPSDRRLHVRLSASTDAHADAAVSFDSTSVVPLRRHRREPSRHALRGTLNTHSAAWLARAEHAANRVS